MMKRTLAILGAAATILLGAVGVTGVARAATPTPPAATQPYPYGYAPGWMMGGYFGAGGPGAANLAPSQAWQAMWSVCQQYFGGAGTPATPPTTTPGTGK